MTESRELALDDREFEKFVRGARRIECDLRRQEAVFIAFVLGRLGLRPGELCHLTSDWIDWRKRMIKVPSYDDCTQGRDGGLCGSCKQSVRQRVEYANLSKAEARLAVLQQAVGREIPGYVRGQMRATHFSAVEGDLDPEAMDEQLDAVLKAADTVGNREELLSTLDKAAEAHIDEESVSEEEARDEMWSPKTENAARLVPFDWNARAELVLEDFFDRFDRFPEAQTTINRRVDEVIGNVDGWSLEKTTPHGLRATAATHLAGRGLEALVLTGMFGWTDVTTARVYVANSPTNTQRQLHQIYKR
jgi:integrase